MKGAKLLRRIKLELATVVAAAIAERMVKDKAIITGLNCQRRAELIPAALQTRCALQHDDGEIKRPGMAIVPGLALCRVHPPSLSGARRTDRAGIAPIKQPFFACLVDRAFFRLDARRWLKIKVHLQWLCIARVWDAGNYMPVG